MGNSYAKVEYTLRPNVLEVNGVSYTLTQTQYDSLKGLAAECAASGTRLPQWLVFMNPDRITRVEYTCTDGEEESVPDSNLRAASHVLRERIQVVSGSAYTPGSVSFEGMSQAVYTFDNGVSYRVAARTETGDVYVEASGMKHALRYKTTPQSLASFVSRTEMLCTEWDSPATGKPVIYLYPEKTQDVSVALDFKGTVTYTYPAMGGGWNVTASPDGTLVNKADGSTHYYLFWEGEPEKKSWDFSSGFVVRGSEVGSFLREKLPLLGLTPREYNDFITYWAPEMAPNAWNLITFATREYEDIAALDVSPAPDRVIRVHMVWKPLAEKISVPEQKLPVPPERQGFTLVEWGGTRAK